MSDIKRDSIHGPAVPAPLHEGETLLATWQADKRIYWRGHAIMAIAGGILAGVVLALLGNPAPWVGPIAATAALGLRGAYLASEALALTWRLTSERLLGPGGHLIGLAEITHARPFFGDVQVITHGGNKYLMKYMADAQAVVAAIDAARKGLNQ